MDGLAIGLFALTGLVAGRLIERVAYALPRSMEEEWRADVMAFLARTEEQSGLASVLDAPPAKPADRIPARVMQLLRCFGFGAGLPRTPVRSLVICFTTAVISGGVAARYGVTPWSIVALLLGWTLVLAAVIDFDTLLLPDAITLPLLWAGLLLALVGLGRVDLASAVTGAVAGYLSLWIVFIGFWLLRGVEGMGHGDFKFLGALGAWLGPWAILPIVLISSLSAIAYVTLVRRGQPNAPLFFGPFIALGGIVVLLWPAVTRAVLQ